MKGRISAILIVGLLLVGAFSFGGKGAKAEETTGTEPIDDSASGIDAVARYVGLWTSLAIDSANNEHLSYYDQTNGDLKYVKKTAGGSWGTPEIVDSSGDVGQYSAIAVDSSGGVHIVYQRYYSSSNGDLKYAFKPQGGSWYFHTIEYGSSIYTYKHCSIAIAYPSNLKRICISYMMN